MLHFPCHSTNGPIELISQKVFQELLIESCSIPVAPRAIELQSAFLRNIPVIYVLRECRYCKKDLEVVIRDKLIKFIIKELSKLTLMIRFHSNDDSIPQYSLKQLMEVTKFNLLKC